MMNSTKNLMAGLLGMGAMLMAGDASAARVWTKKLATGVGGPAPIINANGTVQPQKNASPANEQGHSAFKMLTLPNGQKAVDIMTVWMSGAVPNQDRPNQCKVSVLRLTETTAPVTMLEPTQISGAGAAALAGGPQPETNNNADRPCNHPDIQTADIPGLAADQAAFMISRGTDSYNTNVQTRARMFLNTGAVISTANNGGGWQLLSNNNNNNIGAVRSAKLGAGLHAVGVNNNSDTADLYAVNLNINAAASGTNRMVTIERTDAQIVVDPSNIGRPYIQNIAPGEAIFMATESNNRPPEIGLSSATIKVRATDGQVQFLDGEDRNANGTLDRARLVVASRPNAPTRAERRYVQASYLFAGEQMPASGRLGKVSVSYWESDGGGNDGNNRQGGTRGQRPARGATKQYIQTFNVADETGRVSLNGSPMMITAVNGTHITVCTGQFGPAPTTPGASDPLEMAFLDLSITGAGVPTMGFAQKDAAGSWRQLATETKAVSSGLGDSGYLANLLGQDPNRSGRDFAECMGDVPNPGANKVDSTFRPNVDTFFLATYSGKDTNVETEKKNAQWLTLVPGRLNNFQPPVPVQSATATTGGGPVGGGATTGGQVGGGTTGGQQGGGGGGAQCVMGREACASFPSGDCYDGLRPDSAGICRRADGNGAGAGAGAGNGAGAGAGNGAGAAAAAATTTNNAAAATTTNNNVAAANNGAAAANNNAAATGGGDGGGSDGGCSSSETGSSGLTFMLLALIGLIIRRRS